MQAAYKDIDEVIKCLESVREDDSVYQNLFEKMEKLYGGPLNTPRLCQRQTLRSNHNAETAWQFYKIAYFNPYVDHLIADLKERFQHAPQIVKGMIVGPQPFKSHQSHMHQV